MGTVLKNMFIWKSSGIIDNIILNFNVFSSLPYIIIGIIGSVPIITKIKNAKKQSSMYNAISSMWVLGIFILSVCFLLVETYNPFIYFRF